MAVSPRIRPSRFCPRAIVGAPSKVDRLFLLRSPLGMTGLPFVVARSVLLDQRFYRLGTRLPEIAWSLPSNAARFLLFEISKGIHRPVDLIRRNAVDRNCFGFGAGLLELPCAYIAQFAVTQTSGRHEFRGGFDWSCGVVGRL